MTDAQSRSLDWKYCDFERLTLKELHDLLMLRQQIFVIEQECIFPEIDGLDPRCCHLIGLQNGRVVAAARIVPPGMDPAHDAQGDHPAIGRVVTDASLRGQGMGRKVMLRAIEECQKQFAGKPIYLNAQLYLKDFYQSLGFVQDGEVFEEDGIPHITMWL